MAIYLKSKSRKRKKNILYGAWVLFPVNSLLISSCTGNAIGGMMNSSATTSDYNGAPKHLREQGYQYADGSDSMKALAKSSLNHTNCKGIGVDKKEYLKEGIFSVVYDRDKAKEIDIRLEKEDNSSLRPEHIASLCIYVGEQYDHMMIKGVLQGKNINVAAFEGYSEYLLNGCPTNEKVMQRIHNVINCMKDTFKVTKQKDYPTLYRGTRTDACVKDVKTGKSILLGQLKPGDIFSDQAFVSTSLNENIATAFAENSEEKSNKARLFYSEPESNEQHVSVFMTIHNAVGLDVSDLSSANVCLPSTDPDEEGVSAKEEEILLPPNTIFYVDRIDKKKDMWDIIVSAKSYRSIAIR